MPEAESAWPDDSVSILLSELFGISHPDAEALFFPYIGLQSITKSEVIANIDRILAGQPVLEYDDDDDDAWPETYQ